MYLVRAFLCYSHLDKEIVLQVKKVLDRRGVITWLDEFQVGLGESIRKAIEVGISSSNYLLYFVSPNSIRSGWTNAELDAALANEIESGEITVVPVIIEDCALPSFLKMKKYIDLGQDREPNINKLADMLIFSNKAVYEALDGRWQGPSGTLYLSVVANTIVGKYDWQDEKAGNLYGQLELNRIKFRWSWDHTNEKGSGLFEIDESLNNLTGGWWLEQINLDPDQPLYEIEKLEGFVPWQFVKIHYLHDQMANRYPQATYLYSKRNLSEISEKLMHSTGYGYSYFPNRITSLPSLSSEESRKPSININVSARVMRQILSERLNESELHTLCFDLELDYESLPGNSKADRARELVSHFQRRHNLHDLAAAIIAARPDIRMDDFSDK